MSGLIALAAMAIPEDNPPPLIGIRIASRSGTWLRNSTDIVP